VVSTYTDLGRPMTSAHQSRELLQPIVETARAVFGAAASSIFILDVATESLVFGAVAGAGEESLVGRRFPADTGIAGWVVKSQQGLRLDDLTDNPLFDRAAAESTVYVPRALMAAPLLFEDECVGVLEVLDWTEGSRGEMADLALLGQLARQAAAAVRMLAGHDWQLDPYRDPRAVALCRQIMDGLTGLSPAELDTRLEMLRAVAKMYGASNGH
jgi:GAF domain-containing protein